MKPPRTEDELVRRAQSLEGRSLGVIAERLGAEVPAELRRHKGWVGELLERALGATGGASATCDFPDLGVELKTVPLDSCGRPRESTCVCVASLGHDALLPWEDCWLRQKLGRVLWVPIVGRGAPRERVVGRARLWSPSASEEAVLCADWEELAGRLGLGHFDEIDASWGVALQVRPKASSGRERRWAMSAEAEWVQVNPRGFYLRAGFVRRLLAGVGPGPESGAGAGGTPPKQ